MSRYDYQVSRRLIEADPPFTALIMAAIRKADTRNEHALATAFPDIYREVRARYDAPGAVLETDADYREAAELMEQERVGRLTES